MDGIEVRTHVDVEPETAFEFLLDFTGYAEFSHYVNTVTVVEDGDESRTPTNPGGEGTVYEIEFGWWRFSYRVRTAVTTVDPPETIEWRVVSDLDAHGRWKVEDRDSGPGVTVRFLAQYNPDSVSRGTFDLPAFLSLSGLIDRVIPLIESEGRRIVERVVTELEGEPRSVVLVVEELEDHPMERQAGSA
ncbi:MAG: SRPBCC family protein [Halodesulfurarchaeum sp.]